MIVSIALEYCGYMVERPCAVGDEIAQLDMSATVMHYWSSGACDPIEPTGQAARYRIIDVDVPSWLVAGLAVNQNGSGRDATAVRRAAALIMAGYGQYGYLRELSFETGKFARSLQDYYAAHGRLSDKQRACIGRNWRKHNGY